MTRSMVLGCDGQDGTYLSALLKEKGQEVIGVGRRGGPVSIDIRDAEAVRALVRRVLPTEIYYLMAFHHSSQDIVLDECELVTKSLEVNAIALNHFLSAVSKDAPNCRLFYASSSHVFGNPTVPLQNEQTLFDPTSPYGISKAAGVYLCRYYREEHGVYCSSGILYNHESPLRRVEFVTRKVTRAAAMVKRGLQHRLVLGNLDARVDWGAVSDYVEAMWRILQLDQPDDFVVATGHLHSVRELVETAFDVVGLRWEDHVVEDRTLLPSPLRGQGLCGDSSRLQRLTGWRPQVSFREIVQGMVAAEMERPVETGEEPDRQEPVCPVGADRGQQFS
jgi:GDPmannose 4,6-dehydratase